MALRSASLRHTLGRSLSGSVHAPGMKAQTVSVTREMAAALPKLAAVAAEKGLTMRHLGAGYPHPEVSDPTEYIAHKNDYYDFLARENPAVRKEMYNYTDTMGPVRAREYFARVYNNDFDCNMTPDRLVPTVGATGGIAMMCSMFERTGRPLAYITDAPTYAGFLSRATLNPNASIYSVEMDEEGPLIDTFVKQIRQARADGNVVPFYYTVPDGHNPGGFSFSEDRRRSVIEVAQDEGVLVVEDAPYVYISFADAASRPKPFVSLNPQQSVHLFTASKIGLPGPRVGFLYSEANVTLDSGDSIPLTELALLEASADILFQNPEGLRSFESFLTNDDFTVRESLWPMADKKLAVYGENRALMLEGLNKYLGPHRGTHFNWTEPEAGFFCVFTFLQDTITADPAFTNKLVADYGVVTIPMAAFFPEDAKVRNPRAGLDQLRLSFSYTESQGEQRRQDIIGSTKAFCEAVLAESNLPPISE